MPAALTERVQIERPDAFERNVFTEIATEVLCYVRPERHLTEVVNGVPTLFFGYKCHLDVPLPDIMEGDHIVRSDGTRLTVYRVVPHRNVLMQLLLREVGVR